MTLKECYDAMGANYNEVMSRLATEERVIKFISRLPEDSNFADFKVNLEEKNYELAFRCVHNIKGMGLNLGLSKLVEKSSDLCEELRHGAPQNDLQPMVDELYTEYENMVKIINQMKMGL